MSDEKLTLDDIACLISGIDKPSNCNDYISRQSVLDILTYKWNLYLYADDAIDAMQANIDKIKALPSVTPAERTGCWNNNACSKCGYKVLPWNETRYCPNCGSRNGR